MKIKTIITLTLMLLCLSACTKTYKIGSVGPAGGIVFYDKGQETDGWRFLEVAPVDYEFQATWGYRGISISGTDEYIGSGQKNTDIIADMGDVNSAAYKCKQLNIAGFSDWFLPSKDELDQMYSVLHKQNLGSFSSDWYWSSSVGVGEPRYFTWAQNFSDGNQYSAIDFEGTANYRNYELGVRAIRAF